MISYERRVDITQLKTAEKRTRQRAQHEQNPCCGQEHGNYMGLKDDQGVGIERRQGNTVCGWRMDRDFGLERCGKPLNILNDMM